MRIVFLDIDGVIVTARSQFARRSAIAADREAGAILETIARAAPAAFVVSSTWREGETRLGFQRRLGDLGMSADLLHEDWATPILGGDRQREIDDWLSRHPEVTHHAILDDGIGLDDASPHLVRTEFDDGLQFRHALTLCALLGVDAEVLCRAAGVKFTSADRQLMASVAARAAGR